MKGCIESPKDLGKGRKQSSRSPPEVHERFWHLLQPSQIANTHCKNLRLSIRVKIYAYGI